MKKYDIFISYRRTSYESANLIATRLLASGYRVFFDLETMRSGPFNKQLFEVIDSCQDFVLILSPNALDRCVSEDDWVRQEVMYALQKKKNIIPILLNGFSWPSTMPQGMEELAMYQGVAASPDFFDLAMQRLETYLLSHKHTRRRNTIKHFSMILICVVVLLTSLFFIFRNLAKPICQEVVDHLTLQVCAIDVLLDDNQRLGTEWEKFGDSGNKEDINAVAQMMRSNLAETFALVNEPLELSSWQKFLILLYGVNNTTLRTMDKLFVNTIDDIEGNITQIEQVASLDYIHPAQFEAVQRGLNLFSYSCENYYYTYLSILNEFPESSLEGYNQMASYWENMPKTGLGLRESEYEMLVAQTTKKSQEELSRMNALTREQENELNKLKQTLDSINQNAQAKYKQVVEQLSINANDDVYVNWKRVTIVAHFLKTSIDIYNDAIATGDEPWAISPQMVLSDIERMIDDIQKLYPSFGYASIAKAFYRETINGLPLSGVIIGELAPGTTHDIYRVGDIIIEWNGKNIGNLTTLQTEFRASKSGQQKILRWESGTFKEMVVPISDKVDNVSFRNLINE